MNRSALSFAEPLRPSARLIVAPSNEDATNIPLAAGHDIFPIGVLTFTVLKSFLGCNDMTVITYDHESSEEYENYLIKFVPVWKWMLE